MTRLAPAFPDHTQNFWQLACITSASQTVFSFLVGGMLAQQYGAKAAFASICVGNVFLWLVGLGIIFMAARGRKNAIQVTMEYLGLVAGILASIVIASAFIFGSAAELRGVEQVATRYAFSLQDAVTWVFVLGLIIAVVSMGGIRIIKHVSVWSMPLIFFIILLALLFYGQLPPASRWGLSLAGVMLAVMCSFPGFVNLSALFRHSHSKADSMLGLSLATVFDILLQSPSIFLNMHQPSDIFLSNAPLFLAFVAVLILVSLVCVNLTNIYFVSVCVEVFFPRYYSPWNYFWIGVVGSFTYYFFRQSPAIDFVENFSANCLVSLGLVLLFFFVAKNTIVRSLGKGRAISYLSCWTVSCLITFFFQQRNPQDAYTPFLVALWSTIFLFLSILFVRYFNFVIKKIRQDRSHRVA